MTRRVFPSLLGLLLLAPLVRAQNDVDPTAEKPVAVWRFNAADEPGVPKTSARFLEPGPRPPTFPAFAANNTAMAFTAANASITIRESDLPKANLRFGLNDSITLEAWVKVAELKEGNYVYIVGKG